MQADINAIIKMMAEQSAVTEEEILNDMQTAIDAGYHNPDPSVRERWVCIPDTVRQNPHEFIEYISQMILDDMEGKLN